MEVKNRVVMAPMATNLAAPGGVVTPELVEHLEERARGGCGAVIVESATVESRLGGTGERNLRVDTDDCVPGLAQISAALHRYDCRAIAQLWHAGPRAAVPPGELPVAPSGSSVPLPPMPRALSKPEIRDLVAAFGQGAIRAVLSGFDGLEVHAAHGYLLHHFIDERTNRRPDAYGGGLLNRYRILAEIREEIRSKCPASPVWIRVSLTPGDSIGRIAAHLQDIGFDAIDVRTGFSSMPVSPVPSPYTLGLAASVKAATRLAVLSGGRILTPAEAEQAVASGVLDAVVLGRALIADPFWPRKALAGLPVRDCKYDCRPSCYDVFKRGEHLRCVFYS